MRYEICELSDISRRAFIQKGLAGGAAIALTPVLLKDLLSGTANEETAQPFKHFEPPMLDKIIQHALQKGGDFADVYMEYRVSRNILMEGSRFKTAIFSINQGAGVRVISGIKTGYAYTDDISEAMMMKAARASNCSTRSHLNRLHVPQLVNRLPCLMPKKLRQGKWISSCRMAGEVCWSQSREWSFQLRGWRILDRKWSNRFPGQGNDRCRFR